MCYVPASIVQQKTIFLSRCLRRTIKVFYLLLFIDVLQWAESQKQCERLTIRAMIVMPMQRLTKYKLLLKAILKKTDKDDHPKDLIQMVRLVPL